MSKNIYKLIIDSKNGNSKALETLLDLFKGLLNKYAYFLDYEDAKNDLNLHFIKVIKTMTINESMNADAILVSYLHRSIKHEFLRLSKKKAKENYISLDLDIINESNENDINFDYLPDFIDKYLTAKEASIIKMIYLKDYSVNDVSKIMNTSRQAVNQCKKRSLIKLRNILEENSSFYG
ncbi:Hypothetical protein CM240_3252 [Clostridium bornimense]|uniref:RNA polymerase sigma-70 region 4 domain-containing protein n=1 Tax=Clostridium bornimense TaxID=1216932 RepID=W6S377_9CLOT|nr:sigma-70 family RNA polymerase sigma factor [Clostridium bornimense]CDM70369.1 Hypothetical protein CM240_3252 [Clostridium bornimense]